MVMMAAAVVVMAAAAIYLLQFVYDLKTEQIRLYTCITSSNGRVTTMELEKCKNRFLIYRVTNLHTHTHTHTHPSKGWKKPRKFPPK
jgi:hypothetical protein